MNNFLSRLHFSGRIGQDLAMGNILRFFGGVLLTALIVIVTLARLAVEMIGASTTPDDFMLLKQRMPAVLSWLFSTPWWVPTMLLFGASAAAAWLIWTGTKRAAAHEMEEHVALDDQAISTLIDAMLSEFLATTLRAEFTTHAQTHTYDEKLVSLSEKAKIAQGSAKLTFEHANSEIARVEARISEMVDKVDKLGTFAEQHVRNTRERFQNVDGGFKAIRHREQLDYHADNIEELAAELLSIRTGTPINNWGEWNSKNSRWMTGVNLWLDLAEIYRDGCRQRVMAVAPEELQGDWPEPDDQFPNIDAIMAYRKVGVILGHFRFEKKQVEEAIVLAAFHAPSMKGREYPKGEDQ